jgi:hypothetical protein
MTSQEKRWKRLIIRWTAPKGLAAILLFLGVVLLMEYLIVYIFQSGGLTDEFAWTETFHVPYVNQTFTVTVSPLFHFLPLSVVAVLVSSWASLTRNIAFIPRRIESSKKPAVRRRQPSRRRFRVIRKFFKRTNRSLQKIGRTIKEAFLRVPGFSKLSRRLFFARTAVRSAVIILLSFVSFALLAYSLAYPWWIHNAVVNLYRANPSFTAFVIGTHESLQSVGQTLTPLKWAAASINNTLLSAAPGFRKSVESLGSSLKPLTQLGITEKYILVQNLAAWVCALITLAYGKYASTRRYKRR